MKIFVTIVAITISIISFGQSGIQPHKTQLFIKVFDVTEKAVPFFKIYLKTSDESKVQSAITDSKGNCSFNAITGYSYKLFISDTQLVSSLSIPLNALSYYTYKINLPELTTQQVATRSSIDTIDQYRISAPRPDPGNIFFKVGLKNHMSQAVKHMEVRLFNPKSKTVYISETNNYGEARFHVPSKSSFIVGVNNFENFDSVTVPNYSYGLILTYIPTKIREYETNDTITQAYDAYMRTTTDRALLKVHLKDHNNKALENEPVYLDVIGSTKVYAGKTGKNGVLTMLLPKGQQYELNFKYERAMKLLDYPLLPTLYTTQFYMTYIGSEKVEAYYANATRNGGFRTEFLSPKITKTEFDKSIIEITPRGYNLNFPSNGPILSPAFENDKLFVSSGFYEPNIYCINPTTAQPDWGIKLAESGPSVLVVDDGILLINTQSCTLYAIDIETGILAWSKWLGPNIYHSPTVADGKVYVSYPNELNYTQNRFVLAAFNLKSGEIEWQNWLKNEPLAAPVCANNQIFITDQRGYLYSFDANNGQQQAVKDARATNPPVFDGEFLWLNTTNAKDLNISNLSCYSPDKLTFLKSFTTYSDSSDFRYRNSRSAAIRMSYSRNRVIINGNKHFQINTNGLQAFNKSGEINWSYPIKSNLNFTPILAFGKKYLLAATSNHTLSTFDPNQGKLIRNYNLTDIIFSEPVVANGWIYCGTKNGKVVAINTKDKAFTGWYQWGYNASHNTVVK